jgi:hypothetical protein
MRKIQLSPLLTVLKIIQAVVQRPNTTRRNPIVSRLLDESHLAGRYTNSGSA